MSKKKPKAKPAPAKMGRPTDYEAIYAEMLYQHMAGGFSFESFAGRIRKSRATIYNWLDHFPDFLDAKRAGVDANLFFWERQGIDYLHNQTIRSDDGSIVNKSINSTLWIFNMKNRHGWRDKKEDEESSTPQSTIPTADLLAIIRGNK